MAVAYKTTNVVEQQITVKKEIAGYQLNLTQCEAEMLLNIMNKIGGSPDTTPRFLMDNIRAALWKAGVPEVQLPVTRNDYTKGSIYFQDSDFGEAERNKVMVS